MSVKTIGVVGGGVAGLSAGALLARQGFRVHLFEASDRLGGCCATRAMAGFTFNDGALYLAMPGLLDHVFQRLGLDRDALVPLRRIEDVQTTILPDGSTVTLRHPLELVIAGPAAAAQDPSRLERELRAAVRKWEPVLRLFADDILRRPFSIRRILTKGWRHLPKLRGDVAAEVRRLFADEAVRASISGMLLFAGAAPERMSATMFVGAVAMISDGVFLPLGGMGSIPEALAAALDSYGGSVHRSSPVRRIVVERGRVVGLDVDGHEGIAVDAVVSTVSGMLTFGTLLDSPELPGKMRRKLRRVPLSHRSFSLQLGLRNRVEVAAHLVNILPFMEEQHRIFSPEAGAGRWPIYSVPTHTLPELAPPGGSIIEMFPSIDQDRSPAHWTKDEEESIAEQAVGALRRRHELDIVVQRVMSPRTYQRALRLYEGAIYGLAPTAPPTSLFAHRTPIAGLFQAGQTTYPGFGVAPSAMSGVLAADALAERLV